MFQYVTNQREILIKLWVVYLFVVSYYNLTGKHKQDMFCKILKTIPVILRKNNQMTTLAYAQAPLFAQERNPKESFRDIRNYLAGQFIGSTRDENLLDEVLKCLFYKMYVELGYASDIAEDADPFERAKHARSVFGRVRNDFPDIYSADTEILLNPEAIVKVLDACAFSLITAASDPVGDAFEVFIGGESKNKSGQFFTPRSATDLLVELVDPQPNETIIDPACGAGGFLAAVARHYLAAGVDSHELATLAQKLYGIDKDHYLSKLAHVHVSLLTGGKSSVMYGDSLALTDGKNSIQENLPKDGFDVLLTNPPFGTRIVAASPKVLQGFNLARKWRYEGSSASWKPTTEIRSQVPPQVLFVERCLSLVKDGGRLGMVLPESMVSNKSYRFVVQYLMERSHVTSVIGMPESLFKTSGKGGTHTKTCLVVAQKDEKKARGETTVFMAEAKWCGHDSRARTIPNNDLPTIGNNLKNYKTTSHIEPSTLGFILKEGEIKDYVLCPHYYDPKVEQELAALETTHDLLSFGDLVKEKTLDVATGDELGKLAYGTGEIPFVRTSDISNWEIKVDTKHGVEQAIYKRLKRKQDVKPYDIFMVKDGTYLIGTCAIITPMESEILYQSHLYKIRVNKNDKGITPFLLLAVLSSPLVQRQIKAKQFTQDIIDSLGERVYELVLPIPKSIQKREQIDSLVRQAIEKRTEAREFATEARELVGARNGNLFALRNSS